MNFVKIADKVINLAQVVKVERFDYQVRSRIKVVFANGQYEDFYNSDPGYPELSIWMDEQQTLLHD